MTGEKLSEKTRKAIAYFEMAAESHRRIWKNNKFCLHAPFFVLVIGSGTLLFAVLASAVLCFFNLFSGLWILGWGLFAIAIVVYSFYRFSSNHYKYFDSPEYDKPKGKDK